MKFKHLKTAVISAFGTVLLAAAVSLAPANAQSSGSSGTSGTVPPDVQTAVGNTTATVQALSPIALSAIAVALVPFGAAMALSFVHKVMSKA